MESALPASYKDATVYIAGPSHAEEVAMGKITGLIAASNHHRNAIQMRDLLRVPGILAYASFDTIGVQVCAAVKNMLPLSTEVWMPLQKPAKSSVTIQKAF